MNFPHQRPSVFFLFCFFSLALGTFLGWQIKGSWGSSGDQIASCPLRSIREGGYQFIKPLLLCETAIEQNFSEFSVLKKKISKYIEDQKKANLVTKASIHFRDYSKGKWLNINEDERYAPASLAKVPVMIAYLKLAESNPAILTKTLKFNEKTDYNNLQQIKPSGTLQYGKAYTIQTLIEKMIKYSDNNATLLLVKNIDKNTLSAVFTDLGLNSPFSKESTDTVDFITVKSYASFFRVLFNATYISREFSEQAISWLTQTDFSSGLVEGTPDSVAIAHKFGEARLPGTPQLVELHDCGIVYYPHRPYLLCIMTQGYNLDDLTETIQTISRLAYEEMNRSIFQ